MTKKQREAKKAYEFCERQEDRYMGSVFVTESAAKVYREKTRAAYQACVDLGMTTDHGL